MFDSDNPNLDLYGDEELDTELSPDLLDDDLDLDDDDEDPEVLKPINLGDEDDEDPWDAAYAGLDDEDDGFVPPEVLSDMEDDE